MKISCKFLLCLFLHVAFFISANAQNQNKIDSLLNVLKTAKEDTSRIKTLNNLSDALVQLSEYDKAKKYGEDALLLSEKTNYKKGEATAYDNIADIYDYQGDYSGALKNHFASLKIKEKSGDKSGIADSYDKIGIIYAEQGNYADALKNQFTSLKLREVLGNKKDIALSNNNIGNIYGLLNNFKESIKYFLANLKIQEEIGDKKGMAASYGNIGIIYYEQGDYSEALKNHIASLQIEKETGNKNGMAASYSEIAMTYDKQGNYSEALKNNLSALKIREEIGDKKGIAISCNNIGAFYTKKKNFKLALLYLNKALSFSNEIGSKDDIKTSFAGLAELDKAVGNYKEALEHFKLSVIYKDSMFNETSSNQLADMQTKYESEKKEKEIVLLNADKKIKDVEIKKQTLLKNSLIGGLALAVVLFFFIYKNYRTRQKLKLENIRNNIAADLHDDIGSTLNSISLFSEVAKQEAGKPIPALEQIGVSARKIIDAMSDIVWTINPENDTFENVIARMRSLAYLLLKAKNIEFVFKADESLNQLSLPMLTRKNIYLLFKEATNNIVKYSNASRASYHISLESKNVKLVIRDNGVGFDMENAQMGNGIKNMKRRAAEIEAQLLIESAEGKGTNIELSLHV